jgi:hypothetical protein
MSYDLGCFYTAKPLTDDQALERYGVYCNEEDLAPWIEPNPRVAAFVKELTNDYPQTEDMEQEGFYDCRWSATFDLSEGHVLMPIVYARAEEMTGIIVGLAEKHGLVCVDPQTSSILTAPPGIHVDEAPSTAEDSKKEQKRQGALFVELLDELLKPHGFGRQGRTWRKHAEKVILALQLFNHGGVYEIEICAWLKERGDIEPRQVKPAGRYHVRRDVTELMDLTLEQKFSRATNFTTDTAEDPPVLHYGDVSEAEQQRVIHAMEPDVPLAAEWRVAALREIMCGHVLPYLKRIETGEITE